MTIQFNFNGRAHVFRTGKAIEDPGKKATFGCAFRRAKSSILFLINAVIADLPCVPNHCESMRITLTMILIKIEIEFCVFISIILRCLLLAINNMTRYAQLYFYLDKNQR